MDIFGRNAEQPATTKYNATSFRAIAVSSGKRLDATPGLPTFVEQGVHVIEGEYICISVPTSTNASVKSDVKIAFEDTAKNVNFSSSLYKEGFLPVFVNTQTLLNTLEGYVKSFHPNLCFYTAYNGAHLFEEFQEAFRIAPGGITYVSIYGILFLLLTCYSFYYSRFKILPHVKMYHPHLQYIRRTMSNFLHLISILLEGIQLVRVIMVGENNIKWERGFEKSMSLADIEIASVWFFYVVFSLALAFLLYELMFFMHFEKYLEGHKVGHLILFPSIYVLRFVGTVAYIPTLYNLVSVFSCRYMPLIDSTAMTNICHIECWGAVHWSMIACSSFVIILFIPSILLTAHIWQETSNGLDIKYDPMHFLYVYLVKLAMVILRVFFKGFVVQYYVFTLCLSVFILVRIIKYRPCFMAWINLYRGLSWLIAAYSSLVLLMCVSLDVTEGRLVMWILISGWLFLFLLVESYSRRVYPTKLVKAAALKKYSQTKMAYLVQSVARPSLLAKVQHMRASATLSMDKINDIALPTDSNYSMSTFNITHKLLDKMAMAGGAVEADPTNMNDDEILEQFIRDFHGMAEPQQWALIEAYIDDCFVEFDISKKDLILLEEACIHHSSILKEVFLVHHSDKQVFMSHVDTLIELIDIGVRMDLKKHHIYSVQDFENSMSVQAVKHADGVFLDSLKTYEEEEEGEVLFDNSRQRISTIEYRQSQSNRTSLQAQGVSSSTGSSRPSVGNRISAAIKSIVLPTLVDAPEQAYPTAINEEKPMVDEVGPQGTMSKDIGSKGYGAQEGTEQDNQEAEVIEIDDGERSLTCVNEDIGNLNEERPATAITKDISRELSTDLAASSAQECSVDAEVTESRSFTANDDQINLPGQM